MGTFEGSCCHLVATVSLRQVEELGEQLGTFSLWAQSSPQRCLSQMVEREKSDSSSSREPANQLVGTGVPGQ